VTAAGDPVQTLWPGGNTTSLFHIALQQRDVRSRRSRALLS
jgi:hypothetical protein